VVSCLCCVQAAVPATQYSHPNSAFIYFSPKMKGFVLDLDAKNAQGAPFSPTLQPQAYAQWSQLNPCKQKILANYSLLISNPRLRAQFSQDLQNQQRGVDITCPQSAMIENIQLSPQERQLLLSNPQFRQQLTLALLTDQNLVQQQQLQQTQQLQDQQRAILRSQNLRPANILTFNQQPIPADLLQ
jgi:hypothetical protein